MKIDTNDIMACSREISIFLIRRTCRLACEHPFVLGMLFFLLMLYIFLPCVFGFLVSSSPIIICTVLLLGTLLSFGEPSIPEIEEEDNTTDKLSPLQVCPAANDLVVKKHERFSMESGIENRANVKGTPIKEANLTERRDHVCKVVRQVLQSASNEEEERKDEAAGTCSSLQWDKNQIHIDKKATDKREVNGRARFEKAESLEGHLVQDALQAVRLVTGGEKDTEDHKVKIHERTMERGFDSSLGPSQKLVYSHNASDSGSDLTESHSPDTSLTGIIPLHDELRPLIDSEAPQPVNTSVDDSHSVPRSYAPDCKYDNAEEDIEHRKEETQEKKYDESAIPGPCTADDEKNHMDLSTSILERSRRLKSLIIKRRARKNMRADAEKSLRGLDANKAVSIVDDLSHIQRWISPVSTGRQIPFDLPFDSEESTSLLQIPGSAPSAFLPRGNLFDEFDFPDDQEDENSGLTGLTLGHQGYVSLPQKEMFFRRYESFSLGASFTGEPNQEKHDIKLSPGFGTGRTNLQGANCADFQRQLSGKKFSKIASVPGSESNSSIEYNELLEQELHQDSHSELIFPCDVKHVGKGSDSPDEVNFVGSPSREKEINICGIHEVDVNSVKVFEEETHETFDDFVAYEMKVRHEMDLRSPTSDAASSDVVEVKCMESSSTFSVEVDAKNFSTKVEEGITDLHKSASNLLKGSNHSVHSFNREGESVNDIHVVQSVHDSSPSATGKSLLNVAAFDYNCTLSIASETQTATLDLCSPGLEEKNDSLEVGNLACGRENTGETHVSDKGALLLLPSNLSSVEEDESVSREADENILSI